jgi:CheY-like chemotaxis protein
LQKQETDLATIIESAIETSRPLIAEFKHHLSISMLQAPIPVYGDVLRLGQVFANLLNNAAKYTDPGGEIRLEASQTEGEVAVSIRDTGIGIAAPMLPLIFDMFTQTARARERSQGGLGIGLTLVKKLVELHRGTVSAHSAGLGRGSEFTVRLPIASAVRTGPSEPTMAAPAASTASRRVLIVDDNEDAAASLAMLLRFLGMEAQIARDGPTALELVESFRPDLVFLDIGMPGMDGLEVARRIRENPELDTITLIALTGWGQAEDRDRTRLAGFNHHLVKPADITSLRSLLTLQAAEQGGS